MANQNSFQSWWAAVPESEKPGLKTLGAIFLIVMALAALAAASLQIG